RVVDLLHVVDAEVPHRAGRQGHRNGERLAAFTDVEPATPDRCAAPGRLAGATPNRADAHVGAAEAASFLPLPCEGREAGRGVLTVRADLKNTPPQPSPALAPVGAAEA